MSWMQSVSENLDGKVVAIDGKKVRRSYDSGSQKAAIDSISTKRKTKGTAARKFGRILRPTPVICPKGFCIFHFSRTCQE